MRVERLWGVIAAGIFLTSPAWALDCGAIPTTINGAGAPIVAGSGNLDVGSNLSVNGSGATSGTGTSVNTTTGVQAPGQILPAFLPSTFPSNTATADQSVNNATLAAGAYDIVTTRNTATFSGGTYYINQLTDSGTTTLKLAAGDYFIDQFVMNNNLTIQVTSGPVRLFIKTSMIFKNSGNINVGGSAANLQVFAYPGSQIDLKNNQSFTGLIYAPDSTTQITLGSNASITGAILSGGQTTIGNNASVTFDATVQAAIASINSCSLLADWHMDEAGWTGSANEVIDSSGAGYHGQAIAGATTANASPAYTSGAQSTCGYGSFDTAAGQKRYVLLPAGLPKMTSDFTVAAWIRSTSASSQHQRIFANDDSDNGWALSLADGTGTSIVRLFNRNISFSGVSGGSISAGNVALDTPAVVSSNNWFFVAAAVEVTRKLVTVYVYNAAGAQVAKTSASFSGTWAAGSGAQSIGGETSASSEGQQTSWHFLGNIDEVRLFRSALSQTDIASSGIMKRVRDCSGTGPAQIRIIHTGQALTCGTAVTVQVCTDNNTPNGVCTPYTAGVTVTLSPGNGQVVIPSGQSSGTGTVMQAAAGAATLSATSATGAPAIACWNGAAASCATTFSDSGFLITGAPHYACDSGALTIQAVKKDAASPVCVPAFADVGRTLSLTASYANPASGSLPVAVTWQNSAGVSTTSSLTAAVPVTLTSLKFDANATATLAVVYADVGKLRFDASYAGSVANGDNGLSMNGSGNIIVGPKTLSISTPAAPLTAGQAFTATIVGKNNCAPPAATPNFGNESPAESVLVSSSNPQPALGNATLISQTLSGASGSLTWNEVGKVDLTAVLASYQGSGLAASSGATSVGRFRPAYFDVVTTQGCGPGGFTYSGQPFTAKVKAKRYGADATDSTNTANYAGVWANDVGLSVIGSFIGTLSGGDVSGQPTQFAASHFAAGIASLTPTLSFSSPPKPPAPTTLRATEVAGDGVSSVGHAEGSVNVYSGRLRLGNAFGASALPLAVPTEVQYWLGSYWSRNSADNGCTTLSVAPTIYLPGTTTPNTIITVPAAPGASAAGAFTLNLTASGATSADVSFNLGSMPWLRYDWKGTGVSDAISRVTFGIYRGADKVIQRREVR